MGDGTRVRRLRLAPTTQAPTAARDLVRTTLLEWSVPHLVEPASLVVSELVSNAVTHARTELELRLAIHADGVCLAVHDQGGGLPEVRRLPDGRTPGGRGLHLVGLLSTAWGWFAAGRHKLVWAFVRSIPAAA